MLTYIEYHIQVVGTQLEHQDCLHSHDQQSPMIQRDISPLDPPICMILLPVEYLLLCTNYLWN